MGTTVFVGVKQNFGAIGSPFGTRTAVTVADSTAVVIPAGMWLVENDTDTTVEFSYNSGSNFITLLAASKVALVFSDGFNVQFKGGTSGGGTGQRTQILGMG